MVDDLDHRLMAIRSASTIEACAHEVHLEVWNRRKELFQGNAPVHPLDSIEPAVALYMKGFKVLTDSDLGEMWDDGRRIQVAGLVDQATRIVRVSPTLDDKQRRYTTSHELGHVIRHPGMSLHRDRAITGHLPRKDEKEREADLFASCFLMPARHVIHEFYRRFHMNVFRMSEDVVFGLSLGNIGHVQKKIRKPREVSLISATSSAFMGTTFQPLCQFFRVSPVTMAIRLEEISLVDHTSARW